MKVIFGDIPIDWKYALDGIGYEIGIANTGDVHDVKPSVAAFLIDKKVAKQYSGGRKAVDATLQPKREEVKDAGWKEPTEEPETKEEKQEKQTLKDSLDKIVVNLKGKKLKDGLLKFAADNNLDIGRAKRPDIVIGRIGKLIC